MGTFFKYLVPPPLRNRRHIKPEKKSDDPCHDFLIFIPLCKVRHYSLSTRVRSRRVHLSWAFPNFSFRCPTKQIKLISNLNDIVEDNECKEKMPSLTNDVHFQGLQTEKLFQWGWSVIFQFFLDAGKLMILNWIKNKSLLTRPGQTLQLYTLPPPRCCAAEHFYAALWFLMWRTWFVTWVENWKCIKALSLKFTQDSLRLFHMNKQHTNSALTNQSKVWITYELLIRSLVKA